MSSVKLWPGMLWNKQFYRYDVPQWLDGDPIPPPPPPARQHGRNSDWRHLDSADILMMPDNWEYPWFAAWDHAFHCVTVALVDPAFAKSQLILLGREWYMHPNGQLPAYEWDFGDVNPPVHAWAALKIYHLERRRGGQGDRAFLERVFHKLMLNFTWWVNRRDAQGRNIFQGGFLGLDNIGVFDRSAVLPTGGFINQSDGTAWMAMYSLSLMRMALELAEEDHVYEDIATKFFEHFLYIARAMTNIGGGQDRPLGRPGPFLLRRPEHAQRHRVAHAAAFHGRVDPALCRRGPRGRPPRALARLPGAAGVALDHRPHLAALVSRWEQPGQQKRRLLSRPAPIGMKKSWPAGSTPTSSSRTTGCGLSPVSTSSIPTFWTGGGARGDRTRRRVGLRALRR